MPQQPRFDRSAESDALVNFIATMPESEVITYDRLGAVIGMSVREGHGRSLLASARRIAEQEHRVFLRAGKDKDGERGLYRCSPSDLAGYGGYVLVDFRRKSKRRIKRLSFADYERLTPDERVRLGASATIIGVVATVTARPSQQVVENALTSGVDKARLTAQETMSRLLQKKEPVG